MFLKLCQLDRGLPVVINTNEIISFRATENRPGSGCIVVTTGSPGHNQLAVHESVQEILNMINAARAGGAA